MPNEANTAERDAEKAERWREMAHRTLRSAERLHLDDDYRGCANRSYYAAYQAATAACIEHGDDNQFAHGWNNPSHDQLPDLIRINGAFALPERWRLMRLLNGLRTTREDADYRPGHTVDRAMSLARLHQAREVLIVLGVSEK